MPQQIQIPNDSGTNILNAIDKMDTDIVAALGSIGGSETVSRTIYVTTTGNDTTGDGTIGLPFLTIGKAISTVKKVINPQVTITINIGIGTFTMTDTDFNKLGLITGYGVINFQGNLVLVESGFIMGAALPLDPVTFSVSGGNTAIWTLDQWKFFFLKSGANYIPITANKLTPTLSIAGTATGTEIYQAQTIIEVSTGIGINLYQSNTIQFRQVQMNFLAQSLNINNTTILFEYSNIKNNTANNTINFQYFCKPSFRYCGIDNWNIIGKYFYTAFVSCYHYLNRNNPIIQLVSTTYGINVLTNCVYENPNVSASAVGIFIGQGGTFYSQSSSYLKFQNCNCGISFTSDCKFRFNYPTNDKIILDNTNYLAKKQVTTDSDFLPSVLYFPSITNILGLPVIRWFFNNMMEFINIKSGRNIQIDGLIYPEIETTKNVA
ncbi:MAG: hypothetical protein WC069_06875, partial [Candidatus Shapirobacteria bacterium]